MKAERPDVLQLHFDGGRTTDSTMDVEIFAAGLVGIDTLYRISTGILDLGQVSALRIDARIRQGSVVVNLISNASDLVAGVGAVTAVLWASRKLSRVLAKGLKDITQGLNSINEYRERQTLSRFRIEAEHYRTRKVKEDADAAHTRALIQIMKLYELAKRSQDPEDIQRRAEDVLIESGLAEVFAPAIAQALLPIMQREATKFRLDSHLVSPLVLTSEDVPSYEEVLRQTRDERIAAGVSDDRLKERVGTGLVTFVGPRLDGKNSGWRVKLGDQVLPARIEDKGFLAKVKSGEQLIRPTSRFRVHYRRTSQSHLIVKEVIEAMEDQDT